VITRNGFSGLEGFDEALTTSDDHGISAAQVEQLMIIRDGSFFANHTKNKWDASTSAMCLTKEALTSLTSRLKDFQFRPFGSTMHAFTDGTYSRPESPSTSLAAWSVLIADAEPLFCGPLEGIQQCVCCDQCSLVGLWSYRLFAYLV